MTKKSITETLKKYNCKPVTWYKSDFTWIIDVVENKTVLSQIYINEISRTATSQMYSTIMIHKDYDISYWFFNEEA